MEEKLNKIRDYIASNELNKSLNSFAELVQQNKGKLGNFSNLRNDLIVLKSQYVGITRAFNTGVINFSDYDTKKNKILIGLLSLLDEYKNGLDGKVTPPDLLMHNHYRKKLREVEITLKGSLDSLSIEQKNSLFESIESLLDISYSIRINKIATGSVLMVILLTDKDANSLIKIFNTSHSIIAAVENIKIINLIKETLYLENYKLAFNIAKSTWKNKGREEASNYLNKELVKTTSRLENSIDKMYFNNAITELLSLEEYSKLEELIIEGEKYSVLI